MRFWADLPPVGGTATCISPTAEDALKRRTPDGRVITLVTDDRLHWTESSPVIGSDGFIWLPVPQMDRVALFNEGVSQTLPRNRMEFLYRISRRLHQMPQVKASIQDVNRHLLERSGLLREPVQGRVDFVHRTFQEYLAAQDTTNTDDVGTVVQNGHLDQWHEVVVLAVGHASQKQREELLARLIAWGDLHLLVPGEFVLDLPAACQP